MKNWMKLAKVFGIRCFNRLNQWAWFRAFMQFCRAFSRYRVMEMAASTSYYMLFAIFPFIIFSVLLIAVFSGVLETNIEAMQGIQGLFPRSLISVADGLIHQIRTINFAGVLSFGLISLILACSKGFAVIVGNLDLLYGRRRIKSNLFISRLLGVGATLVLGFLMVVALVLLSLVQVVIKWLDTFFNWPIFNYKTLFNIGGYCLTGCFVGLFFGALLFIFSGRRGRLRQGFYCGWLMGLTWVIVSFFFSNFLYQSQRYNVLYGGFASLMLLLLWIFVSMLLIYTGALIHALWVKPQSIDHTAPQS